MNEQKHIFPIHDRLLQKTAKEGLLKQNGIVIWMTGLSGSGKSTIATLLEQKLFENNVLTMVLDGDNIRDGLNKNLGFSEDDRIENIRRISEVAKLFSNCGVVTICSFVSPTKKIRSLAKQIVGEDKFIEVFVDTPLDICEQRDVKGLYAKARKGEIANFTGIDAPFEAPENADHIIKTESVTAEESSKQLYSQLLPNIKKDHELV